MRSWPVIQEWHLVVGDRHARHFRTTEATTLLKQVRKEYSAKNRGSARELWIADALRVFHERLEEKFRVRLEAKEIHREDLGRVLIKCDAKLETHKDRILVPNVYGYPNDDKPTFGIGKRAESLEYFLKSRESPSSTKELAKELAKCRNKLVQYQSSRSPSTEALFLDMEETLQFFEGKLQKANDGDLVSKAFLDALKHINALKQQWKAFTASLEKMGK